MNEVQPIRSRAQLARMKKALHGRNKLLLIIGINTGLRVSDLLKLRIGDVRGRDYVTVRETKTGKAKRFVYNKAVKQAVAELVPAEADASEYVFKSRKGANQPISRQQAYRVLNGAAKQAGLTEVGTHTLRKTFGYFAYQNGTDISLLMRIFNHAKPAETLNYIGITTDAVDEVYASVNL